MTLSTTPVTALSSTLTREGARTMILFSAQIDGFSGALVIFDLYRGATLLDTYFGVTGNAGTQTTATFSYVDTNTALGSTTYSVEARTEASGQYSASGRMLTRTLTIFHVKR